MGLRGKIGLTDEELERRGSSYLRKKRRRGAMMDTPPSRPRRPRWLDATSSKWWRKLVPHMDHVCILDSNALAMYCITLSEADAVLGEWRAEQDEHKKAVKGRLYMKFCRLQLMQEKSLMLTPAARARFHDKSRPAEITNPKARFFTRP